MTRPTRSDRLRVWGLSVGAFTFATLALHVARDRLDRAHVALVYLLLVLGTSAAGGLALGVVFSIAGFLSFNFLFVPPYLTLAVSDPGEWLVLVAFLLTGLVAAKLLARAQHQAEVAERRSEEVARLTAEVEHASALREADRLKDALLAAVSHDLRTPLTTIRGLAFDITREGDERAHVIVEEVDRLNRLVADLLDLSRLNGGAVKLDLALNTADDLMGTALQGISRADGGHEIRAALDPRDPLLVGRFDLAHSVRILTNLLENAIKYSPPGAPIDFTVRREGNWLAFRVEDRGPGVPSAERESIFAPFHRVAGGNGDAAGAGLGLAIARGLAVSQGGSLDVTARAGGGSCFTLRLPAAELEGGLHRID